MAQEWTESDEVTGNETEGEDDEGNGENHPKLDKLTIVCFHLVGIGQQETR